MAMPQDVRSAPDGPVFFVADMHVDGLHVIDPVACTRVGLIPTGVGTHGINPSRDGRYLYVTNRGWHTTAGGRHGPGSVSVVDPLVAAPGTLFAGHTGNSGDAPAKMTVRER
jgi:DNA-binding beta-propeller fold protein YncE